MYHLNSMFVLAADKGWDGAKQWTATGPNSFWFFAFSEHSNMFLLNRHIFPTHGLGTGVFRIDCIGNSLLSHNLLRSVPVA